MAAPPSGGVFSAAAPSPRSPLRRREPISVPQSAEAECDQLVVRPPTDEGGCDLDRTARTPSGDADEHLAQLGRDQGCPSRFGARIAPSSVPASPTDDSFVQQKPQRVAASIPLRPQTGHARIRGAGPSARSLTRTFHDPRSSAVSGLVSPSVPAARRLISRSIAATTGRRLAWSGDSPNSSCVAGRTSSIVGIGGAEMPWTAAAQGQAMRQGIRRGACVGRSRSSDRRRPPILRSLGGEGQEPHDALRHFQRFRRAAHGDLYKSAILGRSGFARGQDEGETRMSARSRTRDSGYDPVTWERAAPAGPADSSSFLRERPTIGERGRAVHARTNELRGVTHSEIFTTRDSPNDGPWRPGERSPDEPALALAS